MNITEYIKENWLRLPKSSFNNEEIVIVETVSDEDGGWGHHHYEGWGVDRDGKTIWAYSSGCSCNGHCDIEHRHEATFKLLETTKEFSETDWDAFDFQSLQVSFTDY